MPLIDKFVIWYYLIVKFNWMNLKSYRLAEGPGVARGKKIEFFKPKIPPVTHEFPQKVSAHSVQLFGRLYVTNIYTSALFYYIKTYKSAAELIDRLINKVNEIMHDWLIDAKNWLP